MRSNPANGRYTVVFEREFASLEQIEAVNWDKPTVEYIGPHGSEDGLPEGYGFEVEDIRYRSSTKSFDVILKTASQYLGDVTGYQDQIDQLEAALGGKGRYDFCSGIPDPGADGRPSGKGGYHYGAGRYYPGSGGHH